MQVRSNFLQIPNIAFEKLTNEFDLVGYQKLLRFVGVGNTWKGGNNALAKLLGTSYGRIPKLKAALIEAGFIEIIPGDNGHGEADGWKILDVFEYKATLSLNEQGVDTLSLNEQGQDPVNTGNSCEIPCHQTNNPLSSNEQATLSLNEQHKENISYEELRILNTKERDNAHANTSDNFLTETGEQIEHFPETANLVSRDFRLETDRHLHWIQTQQGIKSRRNFPAQEWLELLQNLVAEGISGGGFREFYQWVEGQPWVEQVAPKLLKTQIGKFNNRAKIAIKKQTGANNDAENNRNQQPTAKSTRAQNAINEYHEDAERRARIEQRRAEAKL